MRKDVPLRRMMTMIDPARLFAPLHKLHQGAKRDSVSRSSLVAQDISKAKTSLLLIFSLYSFALISLAVYQMQERKRINKFRFDSYSHSFFRDGYLKWKLLFEKNKTSISIYIERIIFPIAQFQQNMSKHEIAFSEM